MNIASPLYIVYAMLSSMAWEVEYTDEFEAWWINELDLAERESVAAYVALLEERGPALEYPTRPRFADRGTHTFASCAFNTRVAPIACFTRLIQEERQSSWSAELRRETIAGTK